MEVSKILIVEDEPKVAAFIKKGLEENGFAAEIARDGLVGKAMALANQYKLIILDLNLPLLNGFQLCKLIRENIPNIPVLMLTALGGIDEKVKGFEAGADDYLLKPFEFKELLLRIKALLKRSYEVGTTSSVIQIADLEINRDEKKVFRNGKTVALSATEYKLLEYMALNKDKVLNKMELAEHVWGIRFDTGTNVVEVYINFLRKKMDAGAEKKLIHTRIGMGYILSEKQD